MKIVKPESQASTHHVLPPEKYFRWRAGEITRLEAFCDVVFGFAITLLVVSLEVPKNFDELMSAMRGFVPFAICFAQLIMIWVTHYRFSRRFGLEDNYTVLLNVILLFLVLFYVYPLKFVFTMLFAQIAGGTLVENVSLGQASVLMRIYGLGFAGVFLLFTLMYLHAYKLRRVLGLNEIEALQTRASLLENLWLTLIGVGSFLIAFWNPAIAGWFYASISVVLTIHGSVMGRKRRPLEARFG